MQKFNPENERIKRTYFVYLQDARRMAESTVNQVAAAISSFEESTGFRSFKRFHIEQAKKFKRQLKSMVNADTGKPLAIATVRSRLMALRGFFQWLSSWPGYKSRVNYTDADYFNISANEERMARVSRERPAPTLEQIRRALQAMPSDTVLARRDRALFAFTLLSGARDNAIASLKLKHVDMVQKTVDQDARDVRTKARKTIASWFFPVGDEFESVVREWIKELSEVHLFGLDDPIFPATNVKQDPQYRFCVTGLTRRHWSNADTIRAVFKAAFERVGLPYFNPHSFRKTLAMLGESLCRTPEEFKAWSQNLGHEHVLTTFTSYGQVQYHRQGKILESLRSVRERPPALVSPEVRRVIEELLQRAG